MDLKRLSATELSRYLEGRNPEVQELTPDERDALLRMVHRLIGRDVAPRFILDTVHSTVRLLRLPSEEAARASRPLESPGEAKAVAPGKQLSENIRATLREARAARRSHEVRRLRSVLLSLDRARVRATLGEEGEALCLEVDAALRRLSAPVRRGRPRARRGAVAVSVSRARR